MEILYKSGGGILRRGFTNRRCPKCNGNIYFESDGSGDSKPDTYTGWCLQCGYVLYPKSNQDLTDNAESYMDGKETLIPGR